MTRQPQPSNGDGNRLLACLPSKVYRQLEAHFEPVDLAFKQHLYEPGEPLMHVYFPREGVVSLLALMKDGSSVEVATVGNEGIVGVGVYLEGVHMHHRAFAQVPGSAIRIEADTFKKLMNELPELRTLMHRYAQALMLQVMQGSACNRLHTIEERCARWLLMTHDRVGVDNFVLTHEFLAQMLGVRRASVTVVAGMLQQAGLIRYIRGKVTILDRERLEEASCECYEVIRQEMDRLTLKLEG